MMWSQWTMVINRPVLKVQLVFSDVQQPLTLLSRDIRLLQSDVARVVF